MTTKERLHRLVDELSDAEAAEARIVVGHDAHDETRQPKPEVDIPVGWETFADGTSQPDWEQALRRSRASH
jgi:hypothetical protein